MEQNAVDIKNNTKHWNPSKTPLSSDTLKMIWHIAMLFLHVLHHKWWKWMMKMKWRFSFVGSIAMQYAENDMTYCDPIPTCVPLSSNMMKMIWHIAILFLHVFHYRAIWWEWCDILQPYSYMCFINKWYDENDVTYRNPTLTCVPSSSNVICLATVFFIRLDYQVIHWKWNDIPGGHKKK